MAQVLDRPTANIYEASNQWRSRPHDQRYLTLDELYTAVRERHLISTEATRPTGMLHVEHEEGELYIGQRDTPGLAKFSNYGFGQLSSLVGAPASYLRTLEPGMVAGLLEFGLAKREQDTKILALKPQGGEPVGEVRAFTGPNYGRIWDDEIAQMLLALNQRSNGRWVVPAASYSATDPLRATTLYASDHDIFAFLVDPAHPVEIEGESLFRGFIVSNSETGARSFNLMAFMYRRVCDNRIIWGASEIQQFLIRHTGNGPKRFAEEAAPALLEYAEGSTIKLEEQIRRAKHTAIAAKVADVEKKLVEGGFTRPAIKIGLQRAEIEEGDPTNLWNVVQGLTSYAKSIPHQDDRVDLERRAGKLLEAVR